MENKSYGVPYFVERVGKSRARVWAILSKMHRKGNPAVYRVGSHGEYMVSEADAPSVIDAMLRVKRGAPYGNDNASPKHVSPNDNANRKRRKDKRKLVPMS